jgi:hypothetical protein
MSEMNPWRCLLVCLFGPMVLAEHVAWFLDQSYSVDEAFLSAIHQLGYRLGLSAAMLYALFELPDLVVGLEQFCERLVTHVEHLLRCAATMFQQLAQHEEAQKLFKSFYSCFEVFLFELLCTAFGIFMAQYYYFGMAMIIIPTVLVALRLCERLAK